jgi:hypothetical protein
MWPFHSSKTTDEEDEESIYTEEEYEEDVEYELEVTDDEADDDDETERNDDNAVIVESPDAVSLDDAATDEFADNYETQGADEVESIGDLAAASHDDGEDQSTDAEEDDDEESSHKEEYHAETEEEDEGEGDEEVEDEEEETLTSLEEKHGLLKLAAEHDRVDILQSILSSSEESSTPEERLSLLNHMEQPPLHIAVSFGSTNATTCLLRLGANPALRPEPSDMKKIVGRTAWELAFGTTGDDQNGSSSGWFTPKKGIQPVDMAPSKREGIRHAFTAEALRCIGADDAVRLQQLLESGMPANTDIGGDKDISGWCHEMGAVQCLKLVVLEEVKDERAEEEKKTDEGMSDLTKTNVGSSPPRTPVTMKNIKDKSAGPLLTPVLVRRVSSDMNDAESLHHRLEELDTLAMSLSTYLDNLAEEVSVCHGLLLMGNGASALASHVRALRETQDFLRNDLQDRNASWAETEAELDLYMRRYMINDVGDVMPDITLRRSPSQTRRWALNEPVQLRAQLGASENKIRKLRASIADMSEESEAAMKEVEKRGLTGGIQLVRKLREQIRELEFQVSEAKSGEALCMAKLLKLQQREHHQQGLKQQDQQGEHSTPSKLPSISEASNASPTDFDAAPPPPLSLMEDFHVASSDVLAPETAHLESEETDVPAALLSRNVQSERIAAGQSDAIMKYNPKAEGYMPLDLWQIILRIIGLGRVEVKRQVEALKKQSSTVMIV